MGALDRLPACATTGVGSLPHEDHAEAVDWVREAYELPFCPQLPRLDGDMIGEWLGADPGRCGWSAERDRERPRAWEALLASLRSQPPEHGVVKLQVTGPLTLAGALDRALPEGLVREVAAWVAATAAGQVRAIGELDLDAVVVVDEPSLASIGATEALAGAAWDPLRVVAPAWGLHACCSLPWSLVESAAPDLVSFDATTAAERDAAAPVLARMIGRGSRILWGVLSPGGDDDVADGAAALGSALAALEERGVDRDAALEGSLLSGTCGTGMAAGLRERRLATALDVVASAGRSRSTARAALAR